MCASWYSVIRKLKSVLFHKVFYCINKDFLHFLVEIKIRPKLFTCFFEMALERSREQRALFDEVGILKKMKQII